MEEKTLTALQGSIKKWERILATGEDGSGSEDCPLCELFHPWNTGVDLTSATACDGCPVKASTGKSLCTDSPYDKYAVATDDGDACAIASTAKAELEFLRSLIPSEKSK